MADRFEDLRNYAAVVASGGVNAAAETLGIAKSAVSRRLADLEARLGVTLVDRGARRFELTAVGRDYHRRALEILASLEELDRDAGGIVSTAPIRVAADRDLIPRLLAPALAGFLSAHDGMAIEVTALLPGTGAGDDWDILVSSEAGHAPAGEQRTLRETRQVMCAAPSYFDARSIPASLADLTGHVRVAIADPVAGRQATGRTIYSAAVVLTVPDAEAALAAALAGAGLVQLPDFVVRDAVTRGELTPMHLERTQDAKAIVAHFSGDCPLAVRRLVDHLAATLRPRA